MKAFLNNPKLYLTLFILAIFIVSYGMLIELKPAPPPSWPVDKAQHAAIFAMLTYFALKAFPQKTLHICLGLAIYGGIIEILQTLFTLTRNGSIDDLLADFAGILFGFGLLALHHKVFRNLK